MLRNSELHLLLPIRALRLGPVAEPGMLTINIFISVGAAGVAIKFMIRAIIIETVGHYYAITRHK